MQVTFSTLLKGAKVLKSAGTVSDKFNSLDSVPIDRSPYISFRILRIYFYRGALIREANILLPQQTTEHHAPVEIVFAEVPSNQGAESAANVLTERHFIPWVSPKPLAFS